MELKGKVVVVTGASSGIGLAIAERFAEEGSKVILCARRTQLLTENVSKIVAKGGDAFFLKVDLTKDGEIENLMKTVSEKFGRIDILINNAGIAHGGQMDQFTMKDYDDMMAVNMRGLYYCTKQAIPIMKRQRSGTIINISSGSGKRGGPGQTAYGASKAGVIVMGEALAEELKPFKIKVHTVCPGMVATKGNYPNLQIDKILQASDIADVATYLAKLPQRVNIPEVTIVPYFPLHMMQK